MASSSRPVVGMNVDFLPATKTRHAHVRINVGYFDLVMQSGGLPVIMPPYTKEEDLTTFLNMVDGFILTGGPSLDPIRLGMTKHHSVQPMPERRENSDRLLVRQLMRRQMPLLATGIGVQQLNVACGGNLIGYLPEDMPRAMPHADPTCPGPHRHGVLLQGGSRIEEIYGEGEIRVNSNHQQAIRQVGEGMRVCAVAPDGVIEAIESTDPNWFCIGVQWQPECETASALDMQLFECFVQVCARQGQSVALAA